ncbi:hypothetical protein ACTFIY_001760 [Dictyostelium cf. discoideum]
MISFTNKNLIKYTNVLFKSVNNKNNSIRLITSTNNSSSSNENVGLLGIKELKTPKGWEDLFHKKNEKINEIRDHIIPIKINQESTIEQLKETLYYIDGISRELCDLMDPAQFVMNVIPYGPHKIESHKAFLKMSDTVNRLNANSDLYQLLLAIREHKHYHQLPNDHQLFLNEMIKESEVNGINLKPKEKYEIMKLKDEIFAQGSMFIEQSLNSYKHPPNVTLNIPYSSLVAHLPLKYLQQLPPKKPDGNVPFIPTDYLVAGILKYIPDPNIRYSVHRLQSISNCYDSVLNHLVQLISKRYQLAKTLGCENYSFYELKNKLLKTPTQDLSKEYKEKSDEELNKLIEIKKRMEPNNPNNDKIFSFDLPFYKNQMSKEFYKSHSLDKEELSQYFTLENVLNGLNIIVNKLFNSQLKIVPMNNGESWDKSVIKFNLLRNDENKTILGIMYLDPWERQDKATGCVNHPISLGYKKFKNLKNNLNNNNNNLNNDDDNDGDDEYNDEYNLPKCSITCSFTQNNFNEPLKSRLQHSDVETLFHEFGHALHTLMSRCNFQHLCGTRGPTDFIEIPSTLMENFSWNQDLLQQFAINSMGKPISNEMVTNLKKTRNLFQGIETQEQISLAFLDLKLHTVETDKNTTTNIGDTNMSPAQILSTLHQQQIGIHGTVSNFFLTSFNHLFYYGASYYSYLLAKDYSRRIWINHFDSGKQLNLEKGQFYQRNFLRPGASIDPSLILNKFINKNK